MIFLPHSPPHAAGNLLRDAGAQWIAQLIAHGGVPSCVHLDLRSNDIGPAGGVALFEAITTNETLTSLDLSGMAGANRNHIGVRGCAALAECLRRNQVRRPLVPGNVARRVVKMG